MRVPLKWEEDFLKKLDASWPQNPGLTPAVCCKVELGLFFLHHCRLDIPASQLWFVIAGYPLPGGWTPEQEPMVSLIRHYLVAWQSPYEWKQVLEDYWQLPEENRLYRADDKGCPILCDSPPLGPERTSTYHALLSEPPPYQVRKNEVADEGVFTYEIRQSEDGPPAYQPRREVRFQKLPNLPYPPPHDLQKPLEPRQPLTIPWPDLVATAQWMDEETAQRGLPEVFWKQRLERMRLETCQPGHGFVPSGNLTLNGLYHLCGMVGAGKSTLMDVLAVHLSRLQRRVTIVVSDVMAVLDRVDLYRRLGVEAVPVLGGSQPGEHLKRFYGGKPPAGTMTGDGPVHAAERYLDTGCALLAIHSDERMKREDYPCERLEASGNGTRKEGDPHEKKNGKKKKRLMCPLHRACSVHLAQHEAALAKIWVTTPAGLLYVSVNRDVNSEEIRWAELATRTHDLIIIDEADRVQCYLDNLFNPTITLVGESSLLNFIEEKVLPMRSPRNLNMMAHKEVDYWAQMYETIRTALRRFCALLLSEPSLHDWLSGQDHFTDLSLFERILADLTPDDKQKAAQAAMRMSIRKFLDDPFGEENVGEENQSHQLSTLAHGSVNLTGDPGRRKLRKGIENWLRQWDEHGGNFSKQTRDGQQEFVLRVELALLTTVLQNRLNRVLRQWPGIEKYLPATTPAPFQSTPADYVGIVPAAPMGNTLAFKYKKPDSEENRRMGTLWLMRYGGVGRWLLLNLPSLLVGQTSAGAHTLLMSGTSWAGSSSTFHIQSPVNGLLCAPEVELTAIRQSVFTFLPLYSSPSLYSSSSDAIRISGTEFSRRPQKLQELCDILNRRHAGQSCLERILDELPEDRRKLLLLTTNYEETRFVAECLSQNRWKGKVRYLVRDRDSQEDHREEALQRGRIAGFGTGTASILVAPLGAVERGHNILNARGVAAIGAALFLVRPHPPSDDLSFTTLSINRLAMEYIQKPPSRPLRSSDSFPGNFRRWAYRRWCRLLQEPIRYSALSNENRADFIWTQLVLLWQTIGRLIRGGQPARVYFIDAAFAPRTVKGGEDTVETSLLVGMQEALAGYLSATHNHTVSPEEQELVARLYEPFYHALHHIEGLRSAPAIRKAFNGDISV